MTVFMFKNVPYYSVWSAVAMVTSRKRDFGSQTSIYWKYNIENVLTSNPSFVFNLLKCLKL